MKFRRLLFATLLIIIVIPFVARAETCNLNDIVIDSITLNSDQTKGNALELSEASSEGLNIKLDIKVYDPKDSLEWTIVLKNNGTKPYTFDESTLDITTDYLEYTFKYNGDNIIEPGSTKEVKLVITYKNKVPLENLKNYEFVDNSTLSLNVLETSNKIALRVKNPKTGDNFLVYLVVLIISIISTIILIKYKKNISVFVLLTILVTVVPASVYAICNCKINVESNVVIDGKESTFIAANELNAKMKQLAGNSAAKFSTKDTSIKAIKESSVEPKDEYKTDANIVSTSDSVFPIYMWYEDGTIYFWSEDKSPNLGENAGALFCYLTALEDIDGVKSFDTSSATIMKYMFVATSSLKNIDAIADWDTSNVINMSYMFSGMGNDVIGLESYKALTNWNTSKVTNMSYMFQFSHNVTSLEGLENWNVSNVTNMEGMFLNSSSHETNLSDISALKNWKTSSVTSLKSMFQAQYKITDISALADWDVSNVTNMHGMFMGQLARPMHVTSLKPLANWNTSSVTDMGGMFQCNVDITSLEGLENWDVSNVTTMRGMFMSDGTETLMHITSLLPLSKWDVSKVENFESMFQDNVDLKTTEGIENWNLASVDKFNAVFALCTSLEEANLGNLDLSNANDFDSLFNDCTNLKRIITPKVYPTSSSAVLNLNYTYVDANNVQYTSLNNTSPTSTLLTIK